MPILFVNGTNDASYPLNSYMRSFDLVRGVKQIRVTVNMPHDHPQGWAPDEIGWFVDHHLRGEPGLPVVGEPRVEGEWIHLNAEGPIALREAALHFTTDGNAINQRTWQHRPAAVDGSRVTVETPPAGTTAWLLTVTDQRGAVVSTRVVIR